MKYCLKCRTPVDGNICPECGGTKSETAKPGDLVFLAECDAFSGDILEGSPDGLSVVSVSGDRLYVRAEDHPEAMKVISMLYGQG